MKFIRYVVFFSALALVLTCCVSCMRENQLSVNKNHVPEETAAEDSEAAKEESAQANRSQPSADSSAGKLVPWVEIIQVYDEEFVGFTDLTKNVDGIIVDDANKGYVENLYNYHFIVCKVNPVDEKGMFYPNKVLTRIEVISMIINAFSEEKVMPDENWYPNIIERIKKDNYPGIFVKELGEDEEAWRLNLSKEINIQESMLLTLFCYEKYIGNKYPLPGSNFQSDDLVLLTFGTAKSVIEDITGREYDTNGLIDRGLFASLLWKFAGNAKELWGEPRSAVIPS